MKNHYEVKGGEFLSAGRASAKVKKQLKQLGYEADIIRRVAVAMYEAEINMVIHANGGTIDTEFTLEYIYICLEDHGPGIPDINQAMEPGFSTASEQAREMGFGAGMGLPNMKKNSCELKITSEVGVGTKVEIKVKVK